MNPLIIPLTTEISFTRKKLNDISMGNLTLYFQTEGKNNWIYKAHSDDGGNGLADEVVTVTKRKFNPGYKMYRVELRTEISEVKIKKNEYPVTLFEQFCMIENKYNDNKTTNKDGEDD